MHTPPTAPRFPRAALISFFALLTSLALAVTPAALESQSIAVTGVGTGIFESLNEVTGDGYFGIPFTVTNVGAIGATVNATGDCGPFTRSNGLCPLGNGWRAVGFLSPGQSTVVIVHITLGDEAPGSGIVSLTVYGTSGGAPGPYDTGRASVNAANVAATLLLPPIASYRPSVSPKGSGETVAFASSVSRTFTVQNVGTLPATYALSASCGAMGGCAPNKTSTTVAPGASDVVSVSFFTANTFSTSNTVTLTATYRASDGQAIADAGSRLVTTPAARPGTYPRGASTVVTNDGGGRADFVVVNNGWAYADFSETPICSGWATGCTVSPVGVGLYPGESAVVSVGFGSPVIGSAGTPGTPIRLATQLMLAGQVLAADTGSITAFVGYARPAFSPKVGAATGSSGSNSGAAATLTNTGNIPSSYLVWSTCSNLTNCYVSPASFWLPPGGSTGVIYGFTLPPQAGASGVFQAFVTRVGGLGSGGESDTMQYTVTAADLQQPTFTLSAPLQGTTVTNAARSFDVTACDPDGQLLTPTATFNGAAVSTSYSSPAQAGCLTAKAGSYPLLARPGSNSFALSVSDGIHSVSSVRSYVYDETWEHTPVASAAVANELLAGGRAWADTFYVQNPGPLAIAYSLWPICSGAAVSCATSQSSITIGGGQTAKVWISYTTGTSAPSAMITLAAGFTGTSGRAVSSSASTSVTIDQAAPSVTITTPAAGAVLDAYPAVGVSWCDPDGTIVARSVRIDGVLLADTYAAQSRSGCTTAGTAAWPTLTGAPGTHTISAVGTDAVGHSTTASLTFTTLAPIGAYQPAVTPKAAVDTAARGKPTTESFTIRNAGSYAATYALSIACNTACTGNKTSMTLAPGATDVVVVSFTMPSALGAANSVNVSAAYTSATGQRVSDAGVLTVYTPVNAPLVTPKNAATLIIEPGAALAATFSVGSQLGYLAGRYYAAPLCDGWAAAQCNAIATGFLTVPANTPAPIPLSVQAPTALGSPAATPSNLRLIVSSRSAAGTTFEADTGWIQALVAYHTPTLAPHTGALTVGTATSRTESFTLKNVGNAPASYTLAAACGAFSGCALSQSSVTLATNAVAVITVTYGVPAQHGLSDVVRLIATHLVPNTSLVEADTARLTITAADQLPPTISLTPANGATVDGAPAIAARWCDPDGALVTHDLRVDGALLGNTFVAGAAAGCNTAGTSAWASVAASPGTHTVTATATDAVGHSTSVSSSFVVLPPIADYAPAITPKRRLRPVIANAGLSQVFNVRNVGSRTATYTLRETCTGVAACSSAVHTMILAPGATDSTIVSFTAPSAWNTRGELSLSATFTSVSGGVIADTGFVSVTTPTALPVVGPHGAAPIGVAGGMTAILPFTVSNPGSAEGVFVLSLLCDGWATSNCSGLTDEPLIVEENAFKRVNVTVMPPTRMGMPNEAAATVRLIASVYDQHNILLAADTGSAQAILGYAAAAVAPHDTAITVPTLAVNRVDGFGLRNTGTTTAGFGIAVECAPFACAASVSNYTVAPGGFAAIGVTYSTSDVTGTVGSIRLIATPGIGYASGRPDTAIIHVTTLDQVAPTFTVTPSESSVTTRRSVVAVIVVCDVDGILRTPTVAINGVATAAAFTDTTRAGCNTARTATLALDARTGLNAISVVASDGVHSPTYTRSFSYDETAELTPVVTARATSEEVIAGRVWADSFTVRNPGPIAATYSLAASCAASAVSCSIAQPAVSLGAGESVVVGILYVTSATAATGNVTLRAAYTGVNGTIVTATAATSLSVDAEAPTITLSPSGSTTVAERPTIAVSWCDRDGHLVAHAVRIDGVLLADAFVPGAPAACATGGQSTWASVPIALGTHTIVADASDAVGHLASATSTVTFALPAIGDFQPSVAARSGSVSRLPGEASEVFVVRNAGTATAHYQLAVECGVFASCRAERSEVALLPNGTDTVRVLYTAPNAPLATAVISMSATYRDAADRVAADTARTAVSIPSANALYQPLVSNGSPLNQVVAPSSSTQLIVFFGFPVRNMGLTRTTYRIDVRTTNNYGFMPWIMPDTAITLNPGEEGYVAVQPWVPPGTRSPGQITVTASYTAPTGETVSSSGQAFIVPGILTYGMSISPRNGVKTAGQSAVVNQAEFAVTAAGNAAFGVEGTITCRGLVVACRGPGNSTSLAFGISATPHAFTVDFDVDSARGSTGTITVSLRGETPFSQYADSATYTITRSGRFVAVAVTPHSLYQLVQANRDVVQRFDVVNVGTDTSRYDYTVACAGVASCSASGQTGNLQPGALEHVAITYHTAGAAGAAGSVTLIASSAAAGTARDSGTVVDSISTLASIVVHARTVNPGASIAREQCLTISAGDDAAFECGDLRLVHSLPAVTTMNRARAPTLVYNSAHAAARGIVSADVSVAAGTYPSALHATLKFLASGKTEERDIPWSPDWSDNRPRRIAVRFDSHALGLTTIDQPAAALAYELEVRATGDNTIVASDTGVVAVVDRSTSIFGKGWWLDGLEALSFVTPNAAQILWVGGDGSTRMYTKARENTWLVTPALNRADTLTLDGDVYVRHLTNGARVEFDRAGRHSATVNAQSHRTRFSWSAADDKLESITLPVPTGSSIRRSYELEYFEPTPSLPWRLHVVHAPYRQAVIGYGVAPDGSTAITSITDPDNTTVAFGYDLSGRIASRVNRRQHTTTFEYDEGLGLRRSIVHVAGTAADDIVNTFCATETASLTSCSSGAVASDSVATWLDGPRALPDTSRFYLTRFGAPRLIVDAAHDSTRIERNDETWPLLVTRVTDPRGHVSLASYDSVRGVLLSATDVNPNSLSASAVGPSAITTYEWHPKWDRVVSVTSPGNVITRFDYDEATGERLAQRVGPRITSFGYDAATRHVNAVTTAMSPNPTRYDYDALGNTIRVTTPRGLFSTVVHDSLGRDSVTVTPIDDVPTTQWHYQSYRYDAADRVLMSTDSVRASDQAPQLLRVANEYDAEGNLVLVTRTISPDPAALGAIALGWAYDAAHRKTREFDPNRLTSPEPHTWTYDAAGNAVTTTRGDGVVTAEYDPLNRVVRRVVSGVPNTYTPQAIADEQRFAYDRSGHLTSATNRYAQVGRVYTLGGNLVADTLRIAAADLSSPDFTQHTYVTGYEYDSQGRRIGLTPPSNVGVLSPVAYQYDGVTGDIAQMTVQGGGVFTYFHGAAGQLDSIVKADGSTEAHYYDGDGRETRRTDWSRALNRMLHDETVGQDARGKRLAISSVGVGGAVPETFQYDGMGGAIATTGKSIESTPRDALGNMLFHTRASESNSEYYVYEPHSTRLRYSSHEIDDDAKFDSLTQTHTVAGDLSLVIEQITAPELCIGAQGTPVNCPGAGRRLIASSMLRNTYDGDGHLLLAVKETSNDGSPNWDPPGLRTANYLEVYPQFERGVTEEYRYDALGRRVWVRAHRNPYCTGARDRDSTTVCLSTIERTIYDGDQVLAEIRQPGDDDVPASVLESDGPAAASPVQHFGQVGYVHGGGIDHPLELMRDYDGFVTRLVLHYSWEDALDIATTLDGHLIQCGFGGAQQPCEDIDWPGAKLRFGLVITHPAVGPPSWWGTMAGKRENATGVLDMRNRQYDPKTGRFTQEDPIGLAGGMNLYGFGGGDAVNYSDPFGLAPCTKEDGWTKCLSHEDKPLEGPGLLDPIALLTGGIAGFTKAAAAKVITAAVFWSGEGAEAAATEWAIAKGSQTIGMTPIGKMLGKASEAQGYLQTRPAWLKASLNFAEEAAGDVHVFHGAKGVSLTSIWREEYRALLANPKVTSIIYHIVP